jgi:hypothetical protein
MDILNLFSDPLFVLLFFAASAVVMVPIIWIISCKQLTGTFSVRKFAFDRKYWALAVLNWQYRLKRAEGISTRDFVIWFNVSYLSKGFRSRWKSLNSEERTLFVEILSNPEFIEENLGLDKYTVKEHNRILADWEELKRFYDEQVDPSDDVELY